MHPEIAMNSSADKQLAAIVDQLWDDLLYRFASKKTYLTRSRSWMDSVRSHPSLGSVWNDVELPFTVFLMRSLLNEKVFVYHDLQYDHPCLKAFQNARNIRQRVRIPWGLGVVSQLVPEGKFISDDLFEDQKVVFKREDAQQGNRSIIMASWPPGEFPEWILGAYSPVRSYFDEGDRDSLAQYLSDKCKLIFTVLNEDVVSKAIRALHEDFVSFGDSLHWWSFATVIDQICFLPMTAVGVFRTDSVTHVRSSTSLNVNPYPYRGDVLMALEDPKDMEDRAEVLIGSHKPDWHPLSERFTDLVCTPIQVGERRWLLVRHGPKASLPSDVSVPDKVNDAFERSLQRACLGLQSESGGGVLLELAQQPDVHSLTLVEIRQQSAPLPKYPASLCARSGSGADKYSLTDPPVSVAMHIEAYCGTNSELKPWVSGVVSELLQEPLPPTVSADSNPYSILRAVSRDHDVSLYLSRPISLEAAHAHNLRVTIESHLERVIPRAEKLHESDQLLNQALLLYRSPETFDWPGRCWNHNAVDPGTNGYRAATEWLGLKGLSGPDIVRALKALFVYVPQRPATTGQMSHTGFDECTMRHCISEGKPSFISTPVAERVFRRFGIEVLFSPSCGGAVYLPVQPGWPFFTSLRAFIYYLQDQVASHGTESVILDRLSYEDASLYVLTFDRKMDPRGELGRALETMESEEVLSEGPIATMAEIRAAILDGTVARPIGGDIHTVSSALVSLQRCRTQGLDASRIGESPLLRLFRGLSMPVLNYHFWPSVPVKDPKWPWQLRIVWRAPK